MTIEDLPDELLVHILEYISDTSHIRLVSNRFNYIVNDIEQRVFNNPDKYIEELCPTVYFLLKDNKYHKPIWDKAVIKGNSDLIAKLRKLGYKSDDDNALLTASRGGHKDLVNFFY